MSSLGTSKFVNIKISFLFLHWSLYFSLYALVLQSSLFQQHCHTSTDFALSVCSVKDKHITATSCSAGTLRRVMRMHTVVFHKDPSSQSSFPIQISELIVAHNRDLWSEDSKPTPTSSDSSHCGYWLLRAFGKWWRTLKLAWTQQQALPGTPAAVQVQEKAGKEDEKLWSESVWLVCQHFDACHLVLCMEKTPFCLKKYMRDKK